MKLENYKGKPFRTVALTIGQTALAWNDLHEYLCCLFQSLMAPRQDAGLGRVWHSSTQDRACRQMLREAIAHRAESLKPTFPTAFDDVLWLIGKVDTVEDIRNDVIHSPLIHTDVGIRPSNAGHRRALKLGKRPDLLAEVRWCRDMSLKLRDYAHAMDVALESLYQTWPKRPSLPKRQ